MSYDGREGHRSAFAKSFAKEQEREGSSQREQGSYERTYRNGETRGGKQEACRTTTGYFGINLILLSHSFLVFSQKIIMCSTRCIRQFRSTTSSLLYFILYDIYTF